MPVPVKTGFTPPPMPGMPAPMGAPMGGGMPPAPNPFAPLPPAPLAGPQVPPPMPTQPVQGQGQQMVGSTAGRRRKFGDALEGMLGRNQGIGAAVPQRRPLPMPQMMPRQQMVAPGTPMMRTPSPRPMAMGGEVDIFGYADGGPVPFGYDAAPEGRYYSPVDATFNARDILDFSVNSPGEYNPLYDLNQDGRITSGDALRAATRAQDAGISGSSAYDYGLSGKNYELRDLPEYNPETQYLYGDPSSGYEVLYRVPDYDVNAGEYLVGDERSGYEVLRTPPKGVLTGTSIGDGTFTAEDIMKAVSGLGTVYDEYDITGDGRVTSADALAYSDARGMSERYQSGDLDGYDAFTNAYYYGGQGYGKEAYDNLLKRLAQEKDISEGTGIRFIGGVLYDGSQPYSGEYEGNIYTDGSKTGEVDRQAITGLSIGDGTFTAEDIMKASTGLGTIYDEYDFNKDGRITSDDALAYQKSLEVVEDQVVDGDETVVTGGGETVVDGGGETTFTGFPVIPEYNEDTQRVVWDSATGSWVVENIMPVTPVTTLTGSTSGPGSASNVTTISNDGSVTPIQTGNFGTGSYTASPVAPAEVNAIDYSQFTGDVGGFSGTPETSVLFGPRMNIPTSVSQYQTDFSRPNLVISGSPSVGGLTTTYGPEMVATSPIGAIKLPARPVDIDIFDFLSTPTYGTMYSGIDPIDISENNNLLDTSVYSDINPIGLRNGGSVPVPFMGGGSVPRQAEIAGQPHMLAYINQDEEALLRSFGGSGISGPGGIPSYPPKGPSGYVSLDAIADAAVKSDPNTSFSHMGKSYDNVADFHDAVFSRDDDDEDYTPTSAELAADLAAKGKTDKRSDVSVVDFTKTGSGEDYTSAAQSDTDVSGAEFVSGPTIADLTDDDESGVNIFQPTLATDEVLPAPVVDTPVVYSDRRGNQFPTQAEADASDRAFAAQLALYGSGQEDFRRFAGVASGITSDPEEDMRLAAKAYPTYLENFNEGREINIFDPAPFTYTDIGGIGSSDITGGGFGAATPAPITSSRLPSRVGDESGFLLSDADQRLEGAPIINLNASQALTDDDMGLPSVPVSDLQLGLGSADRQTYYGGSGTRDDRDMYQVPAESVISQTIKGFESRTETPYYDVNAYRAGFGSDTKTDPITGKVTKITEGTTVSKEEAEADLNRRLTTEFIPSVVNSVGADAFYSMNPQQQAALTSIAYNYGKLPDRVASVVNNVDPSTAEGQKAISDAIRSLEGDNDGVNRNRRNAEADLFLGQGKVPETSVVTKSDSGVTPEEIKSQISGDAEPTGLEAFFYDVIGNLGFGLGKGLADNLRNTSKENRQAIINQHVYALQNGATPKTDEEGNYIGFDISTMDTFGDKVLGAEDIGAFLPPSMAGGTFTVTQDMIDQLRATAAGLTGKYINPEIAAALNAQADALTVGQTLNLPTTTNTSYQADADGDGVSDSVRLGQVFDAQSVAAGADPYGTSTEQGFITSDGKEFFVDAGGNVVEVTDGNVPYEVGGGQSVAEALGLTKIEDDGDSGTAKNYTMGPDGAIICNDAGYVYNSETDMCEPPAESAEVDKVSSIRIAEPARTFDEILSGVVKPGPTIAPISANIGKMQGGGMAGLNRAADNFLKALAG